MTQSSAITLRPFKPEDRAVVKDLVVAGLLGKRWAAIDYDADRDPCDID
jgi:hypothetical protein